MPMLMPFCGYRYDPAKVHDLSQAVCPPYDIIPPEFQEQLYKADPHNIVRLELGKNAPDDSDTNNRYTRAAMFLDQWIRDKILIRESSPSIYLYAADYSLPDGRSRQMRGLLSLMRLERFGSGRVFPHEDTFSKPKADRLQLLRATRANLSPIFGLYAKSGSRTSEIERSVINSRPADSTAVDRDAITHRLWVLKDPSLIKEITAELSQEPVYIADGHHRYETALLYRHEMREKTGRHGGEEPFDSILMFLANMEGEGLTILPTHRVIAGIRNFRSDEFLRSLETDFTVTKMDFRDPSSGDLRSAVAAVEAAGREGVAFGILLNEGRTFALLKLNNPSILGRPEPETARLDVSLLQELIIERRLALREGSPTRERHLSYIKDPQEGLRRLQSGEAQLVLLLNATKLDELRRVASNGERMPQKSTYFFPKLLTGLVIHKHD